MSKNAECDVYINKSFYETLGITWNVRGEVRILLVAPDVC